LDTDNPASPEPRTTDARVRGATGEPTPSGRAGAVRRLGHAPGLDGLRAVAVLLILTYHVISVLLEPTPTLTPSVLPGGFLGVDLFFVLSGFLITALLLRNTRFGAFYRRRALRLLPALVVLLGAHVVYARVAGLPGDLERSTVLATLFYYLNWRMVWDANLAEGLGHLWSLAVEEQFYIVWPLVAAGLVALRRWAWAAPAALVGVIALVFVHRARLWDDGGPFLYLYVRTDTRVDSLLVGALLAFLWVHQRTPRRGLAVAAWAALVFFAGCIGFASVDDAFLYRGGFTAVALACAVVILAVLESEWALNRVLRIAPLRAVGRVSYGLYLWQFPVFFAVVRSGAGWPGAMRVPVALAATAAVTGASWFAVERPALGWKRRLDRHRAVAAAPRPAALVASRAVADDERRKPVPN
jgi:peptidoglycan/LPS O-acetylase OafA/YrhL